MRKEQDQKGFHAREKRELPLCRMPSGNGPQGRSQVLVLESTGPPEAAPVVQSCRLGREPHSKPGGGLEDGVDTNLIRDSM